MNIDKFINKLLRELSYRTDEGYPILNDREHLTILSQILREWGLTELTPHIVENLLTEKGEVSTSAAKKAKDMGLQHIAFGFYSKNGEKPATHKADGENVVPVSADEFEKTAAEKSGETPASDNNDDSGGVDGDSMEQEPETGTAFKGKAGDNYRQNLPLNDPERQNKKVYSVGGGYYSDIPNGKPMYKIIDELSEDIITVDTDRKEDVKMKVLSDKEKVNIDTSSDSKITPVSKNKKQPKNKKLNQIDSVNEFNTNPKFSSDGVSDEDFNKNSNIVKISKQIEFTDQELNDILGNPRKFPKKYDKVLLRLLNTKNSKDISITDFTNAAGGGTLASTAGEILTTIGLSIKDDEMAKRFFDKIENHIKETKSESIIDVGWVKSARQVREATIRRYNRMFGTGNWELETMAWDVADEVEALGLNDYKNNKGFSTDTYAKVKVNGESILDEISLKKSKTANLLNTTTNRVDDIFFKGYATQNELDEMESLETEYNTISSKKDKASTARKLEIISRIKELHNKYNKNVPEDAKVEVTKKKQTNIHKKGLEKNGQNLREANQKYSSLSNEEKNKVFRELETMMGQNFSPKQRKQFEDIFAQITPPLNYEQLKQLNGSLGLGTDSRKVQKTSVMLHGMAKIIGNPAGETYDELVQNAHKHASAVSKAILSNKEAKAGLLSSIQEDFPLKSLMSGEENMALGNLSADKQTLAKVFGVDDFDKLQENLNVRETPPPASIVYSIEGQEDIPVAEISTRPDGIGYGNVWKLEMKVHTEFAKRVELAQTELEK